jgi:hypothetical protein
MLSLIQQLCVVSHTVVAVVTVQAADLYMVQLTVQKLYNKQTSHNNIHSKRSLMAFCSLFSELLQLLSTAVVF